MLGIFNSLGFLNFIEINTVNKPKICTNSATGKLSFEVYSLINPKETIHKKKVVTKVSPKFQENVEVQQKTRNEEFDNDDDDCIRKSCCF